jgi:tetratricopeptide (TPR) repeat protein
MRRNLWTALGVLAVGALLFTSYVAGRSADERLARNDLNVARELIYLPSPATARLMAFGFEQLSADWYWVKALQYFVEPAQGMNYYRNLGDFLEVVVGVDPDFRYAYKFAGISIPYDTGRYTFANTERAIGFLQRGVAKWPDDWQMRLYLGYYLLNFRNDTEGAAEQFARAAPVPGAPPYLKRFAGKLLTLSGEIDRAKLFTEQMLAVTEDPEEKAKLEQRLREIDAEGAMREVEAAARRFHEQEGRWPVAIAELTALWPLPPLPSDARLENGTVVVPSMRRLTVYEHPKEAKVRAAQ